MGIPEHFNKVVIVDGDGFLCPGAGWSKFTQELDFSGDNPAARGAFFGAVLGKLMDGSDGWHPVDSVAIVRHTLPPSIDPGVEQQALQGAYMATRDIKGALSRVVASTSMSGPGDMA